MATPVQAKMQTRTRVKICGITRPEDAMAAAQLGVDAIGLVFYTKSPRHVELAQARQICQALPAFVTSVALFLNPEPVQVQQVVDELSIDLLQFHGTESAEFCASFSRPYIKALGIEGEHQLQPLVGEYNQARGLLLDSHLHGAAGGTGKTFDWSLIPAELREKIILAGGLNADNVAQAIAQVRPYGVDLSSGVEASPGIKDIQLMTRLMQQVKRVDCEYE